MIIKIHAQGAERKRLVQCIAQWLGCTSRYLGVPSCAYQVDSFTIEKDGSLTFDDSTDSAVVERLLQHIYDEGFDIDQSQAEEEPEVESNDEVDGAGEDSGAESEPNAEGAAHDDSCGVCISFPRDSFTDGALENLKALLAAKGHLIRTALGIPALPLEITDEKVSFPWFTSIPAPEDFSVYEIFLQKLCEMAQTQKRVTAKEKPADNEKYAFRCFLLRLGFIGAEYKGVRKTLLRSLTGSAAFRQVHEKEAG